MNYYSQGSCWRTILALLFASIGLILNAIILVITNERVPRDQIPLRDLGFELSSSAQSYVPISISDYIIIGQSIGIILLFLAHKYRVIIIRRISLLIGILYLYRAICLLATQMPLTGSKICNINNFHHNKTESILLIISPEQQISLIASRVFNVSISLGLSGDGLETCRGDYIYSGHTVIMTLSYLIFREYLLPFKLCTILWKVINAFIFTCSLIGIISLIITRRHYSIDILLAYYITITTFWTYHTLCYTNLRNNSSSNYLSRAWWWPLLRYFEDDHAMYCIVDLNDNKMNGHLCNCNFELPKIPRTFEWPFGWSICNFQHEIEEKKI